MDELDLGQTIRGFVAEQKLFDRYILKSILGRGGMGIVWRAFDEHLERDVALKFLPELVIHDKAVLDDLKRETKRNLDLTHHHIVRIYDFVQDSQSACISMEFVDGETLSALRIDRPDRVFQTEELSQPMSELCEALTYAHTRASIVHRDLKPANLMVTGKGVLKVTDFGIARSLSDSISMLTMGRGVSGTLLYMSPQQLDGDRPSAADDIYSVGATIYELLTSRPPFYSGGVERQIHEKTPPPMSVRREDLGITSSGAIPEHWEECVADCLAKDPARRPVSAAELNARLRGESVSRPILVTERVPAPPPPLAPAPTIVTSPVPSAPTLQPPPRGLQSKRVFYGSLAAIAVVLAVGIAIFLGTRSSHQETRASEATTPTRVAAQPSAPASATPALSAKATSSPAAVAVASPREPPSTPPAAASRAPASAALFPAAAGSDPTVALVDMNRIFKEYNKTKDSEKKINDSKDAAKKEYDQRADAYKKALNEVNALSPNASGRDDKIAKLKTMEREINEFRQTREKQLQEEAQRLREQIVKEITQEIQSLDSSRAQLVFDRSGMSTSSVAFLLAAPVSSDVSDKIVSSLNKKARSSFTGTQGHTVGLVDMNAVFKGYDKTKTSEVKINEAKAAAKKEYDDRSASYQKAVAEVNALNQRIDASTSTDSARGSMVKERDEKIANLKTMEREINEFRETRERQLQEQAMRMRDGIVKEIDDAIKAQLVSTNSNPLIFDISGTSTNGIPMVVYSKGVPDFSYDLIVGLNAKTGVRFEQPLAKSVRFATVDMNRFFKGWPETKTSEATVNAAKEAAKKEYDDRSAAYKKALEEINNLNRGLDSPGLSADAKTAKTKERDAKITAIKAMEKEINEFRTAREKQLQDEAMKLRNEIVVKLTTAVARRAETEGFNLVFDSSGLSMSGVPLLVIPPRVPDLTEGLLKQ